MERVMDYIADLPMYIVIPFAVIGVILLLREFFCWYFKINRRNAILLSIDEKLSILTETDTFVKVEADRKKVEIDIKNLMDLYTDTEKKYQCASCEKEIDRATYYCQDCDQHFCYHCMQSGARCPTCTSKLSIKKI